MWLLTHFSPRFGPFFVEPIVAGLDPLTYEPYICNMDLIGCITEPTDFVAGGTCEEQLMGMCETLWEPNMAPDMLFECISQVSVYGNFKNLTKMWSYPHPLLSFWILITE